MKKWIGILCCFLVIAILAIVVITRNNGAAIDSLNKDLYDSQSKINSLEEKAAENEKKIQDLDAQVEDLTAEKNLLTAERDKLSADNGRLTESLESVNRNLSSSQQKLQGVLYILTDGEQGAIESILSPYMKIFQDVGPDSPYFNSVRYVTERKLMNPGEEDLFGMSEKATLGEFGEGVYAIKNLTGTPAEAAAAVLNTEKAWLESQAPAAEPAAEEKPAEEASEEAAAEEPTAEEAATEPAAEEKPEEEPAAETAAEEPAAEEAATEPAAEEKPEEEPAGEPAAEEPTAEEPAAEEPAEDETTVLSRERLLTLCAAVCQENSWTLPEIVFPEPEETDANRGDLAIALTMLDQIEK